MCPESHEPGLLGDNLKPKVLAKLMQGGEGTLCLSNKHDSRRQEDKVICVHEDADVTAIVSHNKPALRMSERKEQCILS